MKRITRFDVTTFNSDEYRTYAYRWSRGNRTIKEVYNILSVVGVMPNISCEDFRDKIADCGENRTVYFKDEKGNSLLIRRWSYHRKG